jgi:hypothetical protein
MKSFLELFAVDRKGSNFRQYVLKIDWGYTEFWSAVIAWEDDELFIFTQYDPQWMCSEDPCLHLPQRCHWDDLVMEI